MAVILKKEFHSLFHTFTGWLFLAVNLFFTGLYFTALNLSYGSPGISGAVSNVLFLLVLTIPVLSMKMLAEERRRKTDRLLLTAPVPAYRIVLGKYLAVAAVFAISTLVMALFPCTLSFYGAVSYTECYTALFGYFLYGLAGLAVGLYASCVTESQMIAAVLSFGMLFITYMMQGIIGLLPVKWAGLAAILGMFDFLGHVTPFLEAQLDMVCVVYFLSAAVLMLSLTCGGIRRHRGRAGRSHVPGWAGTGAAACAVWIAVNVAAAQIPGAYRALDMTQQRLYTLDSSSRELAAGLTEEVKIYVLQSKDQSDGTVNHTLESCQSLSGHISVEYVDPAANPNFYKRYAADGSLTPNSLIVESGRRHKIILYESLYETESSGGYYGEAVTGYDGEGQITGAIAYVTRESLPRMYVLKGHGELELSSAFLDPAQKEGIEIISLDLTDAQAAPEDAACVIVNAPTQDLTAEEFSLLEEYVEDGGSLFVTTAFTDREQENFHRLLALYGVYPVEGMVLEADAGHYYQSPYYLLPVIEEDNVTEGVQKAGYLFMPYAMAFRGRGEDGWQDGVTPLLSSSEAAYSKTNFTQATALTREEGDIGGPFTLALRAVLKNGDRSSTLYLFGSEVLFTDSADEAAGGSNLLLFSNVLGSMAGAGTYIPAPVKSYEPAQIIIPESAGLVLGALFTLVLPAGLLAGGGMVLYRRRRA